MTAIDPADLPFETAPEPPSLAPRLTTRLRRPKPSETQQRALRSQSLRNRRNGRDAQREVARLTGAKDIGTLGGIDLDGGAWWGEVKNVHGLPQWLKKGMQQLAMHPDRPGFLFVRNVRQGVKSEVYVIMTLSDLKNITVLIRERG
jgi:hypothetical protein